MLMWGHADGLKGTLSYLKSLEVGMVKERSKMRMNRFIILRI